jgi:hypothetical protein
MIRSDDTIGGGARRARDKRHSGCGRVPQGEMRACGGRRGSRALPVRNLAQGSPPRQEAAGLQGNGALDGDDFASLESWLGDNEVVFYDATAPSR